MFIFLLLSLLIPAISDERAVSVSNIDIFNWESPRMFLYDNLFTSEECDFIIASAKNSSTYNDKVAGDISVYFQDYHTLTTRLQEIERKLGAITGIPPHSGEEPMNVHHNRYYYQK